MGVKIFHATLLTQTRQYFFIFVTVDGGMVHRLCTATISTLMIQLTRKPQVCLNKVLCMSVVTMLAAAMKASNSFTLHHVTSPLK